MNRSCYLSRGLVGPSRSSQSSENEIALLSPSTSDTNPSRCWPELKVDGFYFYTAGPAPISGKAWNTA